MIELHQKTLSAHWSAMVSAYPRVISTANRLVMPFPLAWLFEVGFTALLGIKNKARTKLIVEPDQGCALSTTGPRIGKRAAKMQHQPSHGCYLVREFNK